MEIIRIASDGQTWRWQVVDSGAVVGESGARFGTMAEAIRDGYGYIEKAKIRTTWNLAGTTRRALRALTRLRR
jgi:hypothetical protein